jgi:hypothetical protein
VGKELRILLAVLATYRLASLVASEEGPFSVFDKLRAKLGAYDYGEDGKAETNLGRGIACPLCVGMYVGAAVLPAIFLPSTVGDVILTWLGVTGAQVFLENLTSDDAIQEAIEEVAESMDDT